MLKKHRYLFFITVICLFIGLCGCDKDGKEVDKGQNTVEGPGIVSEADNGWTENIVIVDEPDDVKDLSDQTDTAKEDNESEQEDQNADDDGRVGYNVHSALPKGFPSLKLRAFSMVVTAMACIASLVKKAW